MAIVVTRESDELIKEMGILGQVIEHCVDCQTPTRYWAYGGKFPLCPRCAVKRPLSNTDTKDLTNGRQQQ